MLPSFSNNRMSAFAHKVTDPPEQRAERLPALSVDYIQHVTSTDETVSEAAKAACVIPVLMGF